tara:strand:+ start:79 stop:315 length:237 start_codon:yes stop_codon:yes gene_type:complete
MNKWIAKIRYYLRQFVDLGLLLIAVSVFAEILFGPNVAFFGAQVTKNLVAFLNSMGDGGVAALIMIFAIVFIFRKLLR